jgi:polysaccharide biosynthesis/export protein
MLTLFLLAALQVAPASSADPGVYVVGPNDTLTVTVFNQPKLSGTFVVEADGTLSFPLLGRVPVGGLTVRGVEEEMRKRLAAGYVRDPQVSVSVEKYRSQQVFMMGEVRQPGPLEFTGAMTLIEALARVGATTERAGPEVLIVRARAGAEGPAPQPTGDAQDAETIRVNLQSLQTGALAQNLPLQAGDTVFVPRAETVFVSGAVRTPGEYVIRPGMTVRQAVALAGGVAERGSTRRIQVLRMSGGTETTIDVRLSDKVQPGDTIVVRERFF